MNTRPLPADVKPVLPANQWEGDTVRQVLPYSKYGPLRTFPQDVQRYARPVAYLRTSQWGGTGFLIAPDLLLTNAHVLPDVDTAIVCRVWFNFVAGYPGYPEDECGHVDGACCYMCTVASAADFCTSPYREEGVDKNHLDYTVVRVNRPVSKGAPAKPGDQWGWVPIVDAPYTSNERPLTIIQHPQHQPTYIGSGDGQLKYQDDLILQYLTSTDSGSSGSPVLNEYWQLVGLHHASCVLPVSTHQQDRRGNEGIRISAILRSLEANAPKIRQELPASQVAADGRPEWP